MVGEHQSETEDQPMSNTGRETNEHVRKEEREKEGSRNDDNKGLSETQVVEEKKRSVGF